MSHIGSDTVINEISILEVVAAQLLALLEAGGGSASSAAL